MDPSSPQSKDTSSAKYTKNQEWIKTAESFLLSIQEFFGVKKQEASPATKTEKKEVEECLFMGFYCTTKKQTKTIESVEKETDTTPSWKISLDPIKWFNQFTNSKNSDDNLETEQAEDDTNNN
jgi:hypothetical protein